MRADGLTDNSWILVDDMEVKVAILIKHPDYYDILTKDGNVKVTEKELKDAFGNISFNDRNANGTEYAEVAGFITDRISVFKVDENHPPSYSKNESSMVRYYAGWWGINFSGDSYVAVLCPKEITVQKNKSVGPFKTKFITQNEIKRVQGK